jgi:adenylosuccinate synthase
MFDTENRTVVVVGAQWGDEGKGKLVDVLAERADWVVRYQGGANAGHTVHIGDASSSSARSRAASCTPECGARSERCRARSDTLFSEVDRLVADGIDVEGRLYISDRAHLVLPYHKLLDGESSASKEIGTTGRGIGPAYEDKIARRGVRVLDLRHPARVRQLVERGVDHANGQLARVTDRRADANATVELLERLAPRPPVTADDVGLRVHQAIKSGAAVLLEGAQGSLARHRPRHVSVRHVEQHDVRRRGGWRRHRPTAIDASSAS